MKTISSILFLFTFQQILSAQPSKFPPINDIGKDKSLVAFVNQLKVAVKKKDKVFLISALDEKVMNGFGGDGGIAEFKEYWDWPQDTLSVWHTLEHILNIGGAFTDDSRKDPKSRYLYVFPYVHNVDLNSPDDSFQVGVITGQNVNLREKPDLKAKVITQLTHDVIWYEGKNHGKNPVGDPEWYLIETMDHKKKGWVFWKYVYSPVDYRLFLFKNKKGEWKISTFLEGD
jgi:hypothetical protein